MNGFLLENGNLNIDAIKMVANKDNGFFNNEQVNEIIDHVQSKNMKKANKSIQKFQDTIHTEMEGDPLKFEKINNKDLSGTAYRSKMLVEALSKQDGISVETGNFFSKLKGNIFGKSKKNTDSIIYNPDGFFEHMSTPSVVPSNKELMNGISETRKKAVSESNPYMFNKKVGGGLYSEGIKEAANNEELIRGDIATDITKALDKGDVKAANESIPDYQKLLGMYKNRVLGGLEENINDVKNGIQKDTQAKQGLRDFLDVIQKKKTDSPFLTKEGKFDKNEIEKLEKKARLLQVSIGGLVNSYENGVWEEIDDERVSTLEEEIKKRTQSIASGQASLYEKQQKYNENAKIYKNSEKFLEAVGNQEGVVLKSTSDGTGQGPSGGGNQGGDDQSGEEAEKAKAEKAKAEKAKAEKAKAEKAKAEKAKAENNQGENNQGENNQGENGKPKVKSLQERKEEIKDKGKKEGWTEEQTNARIKKEELDDAYTQIYEKYAPKRGKKKKKTKGGKFSVGQDGKDDPANALMSDYDKAVEAKRKAVEAKDEKAYTEASKKMHEIAGSYSEKTGHDFLPDRQYWKRGKVSRYGGNTSKDLASFAARNPNSIEANIINNINNGNGLENLENLAGGYQDTIENLKRYGFNTNKIKKAATSYMELSETAAKNGLSTQVYETIQKGGKTEAYSAIDALKQKQTALGDKKGNILGQDPGKMQKLPKGELDNLDAIDKEQKELKTSISNAEKLFNKRFKGGIKGYEELKEAKRIHDRGIAEISDDLPIEKPTKTDIKEKGKYRAGFRKRMNEKLGYSRGGKGSWGKVGTAVVATSLVAGTLAMMMGSNKGEQSNAQLYGQQPIY